MSLKFILYPGGFASPAAMLREAFIAVEVCFFASLTLTYQVEGGLKGLVLGSICNNYQHSLGYFNKNICSFNLDRVTFCILHVHLNKPNLRIRNSLPCLYIELSTMPWACNNVFIQTTFNQ